MADLKRGHLLRKHGAFEDLTFSDLSPFNIPYMYSSQLGHVYLSNTLGIVCHCHDSTCWTVLPRLQEGEGAVEKEGRKR